MSHLSVRTLLEDVAKSLADNIHFDAGRESEFNNLKEKEERYIWLLPMTASPTFSDNGTRYKNWNIALLFMQKDDFDASAKETTLIHDTQDQVVDTFLRRLDDWAYTSKDTVGFISISGVNQVPFYKDQAGVYSGWLVRLTAQVSDDFFYCTPDNERIYAGTY
jgi:hypothetical protein